MTKKSQYISELSTGQPVRDYFLLADPTLGQSRNGPYWSLKVQDKTGAVPAKIWSPRSQDYPSIESGSIAIVTGVVESYRDTPQIKIDHLQFVDSDNDTDLADFLPSSDRPAIEMMEELEDLVTEHMQYAPWKKFCRKVLKNEEMRNLLLTAPGAKTVHHAYVGGLLEHTLSVAKLCMAICDVYPTLDRQTLLAGAIFHDIGKAIELTGGLENGYSDEGKLLGHIQLGQDMLEPFIKRSKDLDDQLKLHLRHLITSHHGEHDFGAPVRPKTAEAFILHMADNMDAKQNMIEAAHCEMDKAGTDWSPYLRFLERDIFKPAPTPGSEPRKPKKQESQCSLPLKG